MNFEALKKAIIAAPINNSRMTDLAIGSIHNIAIDVDKDGKDIYFLVDATSKKRTPSGANALAAMRIVSDENAAKLVTTTRDARNSADYKPLQAAVAAEAITLNESTKFKVVHQLEILDPVTNVPYYANDNYNGYPAYLKAAQKAGRLLGTERQTAFTEATEALRASGLKVAEAAAKKLKMPVFVVTA